MTLSNTAYKPSPSLPLMIWLSPSFPVGSFAYSHALEWAARAGDLTDAPALDAWIDALIRHGAARNDAILLSAGWHAARNGETADLHDANNLALALAGSRERLTETSAQGAAFRIAIRSAWNSEAYAALDRTLTGDVAYPIAVGMAAAAHGFDVGATLDAYLTALVSNLTSAAIRLGVLGQTDSQRIIMQMLPAIRELAEFAAHADLDDVGTCAFRSDIASMRHETQPARLFRT